MAFKLETKSGYNMYTMASLLQKAIRRGDENGAGYAAYEMFGNFHTVLWNRILTVSAEDCWGIVTKEIIALRYADEMANQNKKWYAKDTQYVAKAVNLLCKAKKSRDACYYACNFVLSTEIQNPGSISELFIKKCKDEMNAVSKDIMSIKGLSGKIESLPSCENERMADIQMSLFDFDREASEDNQVTLYDLGSEERVTALAALLRKGIRTLNMELAGYAIHELRKVDIPCIWKMLYVMANNECNGTLVKEVLGLKIAEDYVNRKKPLDKRDEIYVCKAVMLIMYHISDDYGPLESVAIINTEKMIEWTDDYKRIEECYLMKIPEWVFDVHTYQGKAAGKTDWEMNLVEYAALKPLQIGFFDNASWEPRYQWKYKNGKCTEKEYRDMLEYRIGRRGNPVEKIPDKFQ